MNGAGVGIGWKKANARSRGTQRGCRKPCTTAQDPKNRSGRPPRGLEPRKAKVAPAP